MEKQKRIDRGDDDDTMSDYEDDRQESNNKFAVEIEVEKMYDITDEETEDEENMSMLIVSNK